MQTVSATDPALRQKTMIGASLRAEKHLGKSWKIFATYAYDRSLSNVTLTAIRRTPPAWVLNIAFDCAKDGM